LQKSSKFRRRARHLLTFIGLAAVAAAVAEGGPIVTGLTPGTTFPGTAEAISPGFTSISGTVTAPNDFYIDLTGLPAGDSFSTLDLQISNTDGNRTLGVVLLPSSGPALTSDNSPGLTSTQTWSPSGNVPGDGVVVVELQMPAEGFIDYSVTLTTPSAPEPATLGVVGLGLAAVAALARRRAVNSSRA
jgi:hypothetical protein